MLYSTGSAVTAAKRSDSGLRWSVARLRGALIHATKGRTRSRESTEAPLASRARAQAGRACHTACMSGVQPICGDLRGTKESIRTFGVGGCDPTSHRQSFCGAAPKGERDAKMRRIGSTARTTLRLSGRAPADRRSSQISENPPSAAHDSAHLPS